MMESRSTSFWSAIPRTQCGRFFVGSCALAGIVWEETKSLAFRFCLIFVNTAVRIISDDVRSRGSGQSASVAARTIVSVKTWGM